MLLAADGPIAGWAITYIVGGIVVLAVVALVVPILLYARKIGDQAGEIDALLGEAVDHTAALADLQTTIDSAGAIIAGLERGRGRLGG